MFCGKEGDLKEGDKRWVTGRLQLAPSVLVNSPATISASHAVEGSSTRPTRTDSHRQVRGPHRKMHMPPISTFRPYKHPVLPPIGDAAPGVLISSKLFPRPTVSSLAPLTFLRPRVSELFCLASFHHFFPDSEPRLLGLVKGDSKLFALNVGDETDFGLLIGDQLMGGSCRSF